MNGIEKKICLLLWNRLQFNLIYSAHLRFKCGFGDIVMIAI